MRKVFVASLAVLFVLLSVSAYACGNKNSSSKVDATKSKATTAQACTKASSAKVQTADATVNANCASEAKAQTAQATTGTAGADCCAAGSAKASQVNSAAGEGFTFKAQNASVNTAGVNCPASAECPVPCDKSAKNIKATVDKPAAAPATVEVAAKTNDSE